jgi:hypothetical protein
MTQEAGDNVQQTAGSEQQRDEVARQRGNEILWLRLAGLAAILLLIIRLVACQPSGVEEAEKSWQAGGVEEAEKSWQAGGVEEAEKSWQAGGVEEAEKRWQAAGVADYRIQVREVQSIWCYYQINLEVQDSQVVSGTITAYPGPAQSCQNYTNGVVRKPIALSPDEAARWAVPGLFEIARSWEGLAGQKDMEVKLEFDPKLGYPTRLHMDNTVIYDDDAGLNVLQFEPLGP